MRVLIIGYRGQLGSDLRKAFDEEDLTLTTQDQMRVEHGDEVHRAVGQAHPDLIVNCSAFHRVEECEDTPSRAFDVNAIGVYNLAQAASKIKATLVHFSTDYVFDGQRREPYAETDLPFPTCVYGVSKLSGEFLVRATLERHFVFRVSGLYGYAGSREKGSNFVEMMLDLARDGKPITVVDDQVLTPTSTVDVASAVRRVISTDNYGLYHLTNTGQCSWYQFAKAVFELTGLQPAISPITSAAFPAKAKRPQYSVLDNCHLRDIGLPELPHWRDALESYIEGRCAAGHL